jgi:proteasome assembly chaperone (PAC2) family protein
MNHLVEFQHPELRDPVLLVACAGWNDAAESATMAARLLIRQWNAEVCAEIDPEEFFVFTETRPHVRGADAARRQIIWPQIRFFAAHVPDSSRDFLILLGVEPQLRWKTFVQVILDYAAARGASVVLSLGGLLADVLHSRPPVLTGSISDTALARRLAGLGLRRSHYEGPTGILGVLGAASRDRGLISGSIWGNVPHYIASTANPVVARAIVQTVASLFDLTLDLSELDHAAERFNAQIAQAIAADPDVANYVRQLEQRIPAPPAEPESPEPSPPVSGDLPSAETIVQQLEEFLRQRRQDEES